MQQVPENMQAVFNHVQNTVQSNFEQDGPWMPIVYYLCEEAVCLRSREDEDVHDQTYSNWIQQTPVVCLYRTCL